MSSLKQTQVELITYLSGKKEGIPKDLVCPNRQGCFKTPINIYKYSIIGKFLEAFREIFYVCEKLVGETFFAFAVKEYFSIIEENHFDICLYGKAFHVFLKSFKPAQSLPYLSDIAQFEWICHEACLGPDAPRLDFEALRNLPFDDNKDLYFHLPPHAVLFDSPYPILKIWQLNQPEHLSEENICLDEGRDQLFIWRKSLDLRVESLDEIYWFCLNSFANMQPLSKMFYFLNKEYKQSERQCQDILADMLQRGWLVGFSRAN